MSDEDEFLINEARTIWGSDAVFDVVLSVGCGQAQRRPISTFILPGWLTDLFTMLIETMNGDAAWKKFQESVSQPMLDRCNRLNVRFPGETEPALDDVNAVNWMERLAKSSTFHYQIPKGDFTPVFGQVSDDSLEVLADSLKASLYFFELKSITQQDDVSIIKGWICCRLPSDRKSYRPLIEETSCFQVKGNIYAAPTIQGGERLKMDVSFQQQDSRDSDQIRIDVKFRQEYFITISGFPVTLRILKAHWNTK